jgi:hypothetical protein
MSQRARQGWLALANLPEDVASGGSRLFQPFGDLKAGR